MKPALVFVFGALGLFALAKYQRVSGQRETAEQPAQPARRTRSNKLRGRHRSEDGLLDINSATIFELKELQGIGDALAARIVENRPYTTKIDLVGRRVIPDGAYEVIKHSITVRHAA